MAADRNGDALPDGAVARLGTTRLRHNGWVSAAAFSADGELLATAGRDCTIRLWRTSTGKQALQLDVPGGSPPRSIAFSPDGKFLAASSDRIVAGRGVAFHVWDLGTGRQRFEKTYPLTVSAGRNSIAFAPDGHHLALAADAVHLIDTARWEETRQFKERTAEMRAVAFADRGKLLVALGTDSSLQGWHTDDGKLLFDFGGHDFDTRLTSLACSPNSATIALGDREGTLWFRDARTGKEIRHVRAHDDALVSLACSTDGKLLASASRDESIALWDPESGELQRRLKRARNVDFVALSAHGENLAWGARFGDRAVHIVDTATAKEQLDLPGHLRPVSFLAFAPDGKALWSSDGETALLTWEPTTGKRLQQTEVPEGERLCAMAFDQRLLATFARDGTIHLRDDAGDNERHILKDQRGNGLPQAAFSPDAKLLAVVDHGPYRSGQGIVRVWDVADSKQVRELTDTAGSIRALVFSPDGRMLISGGNDLIAWDLATGKRSWEATPDTKGGSVQALAISPGGQLLAVSFSNRAIVRVLETASGNEICSVNTASALRVGEANRPGSSTGGATMGPTAVALAPDGRTLVTGATIAGEPPGTIHLWDLLTGKEYGRFEGHTDSAGPFAFSPRRNLLASGSADTTVLVWDLDKRRLPALLRKSLSPDDVKTLWAELGGADAAVAQRALWALAGDPLHTLPLLKEQLRPVPVLDRKRLDTLIAELDDDDFDVRENASAELGRLRALAADALRTTLKKTQSLEVRRRIEPLLEKPITTPPTGGRLRSLRAVRLLQQIGTPDARAILEKLAQGAGAARLTWQARAALATQEPRTK